MLIGKLMTEKALNKKSIMATMKKGWNLGEETEIVEMSNDTFVFIFATKKNKERILKGRPWSI